MNPNVLDFLLLIYWSSRRMQYLRFFRGIGLEDLKATYMAIGFCRDLGVIFIFKLCFVFVPTLLAYYFHLH